MSKMQNLYTGGAGQAAVMSEFLFRGYNVAIPEVDRGDDLFVVADASGAYTRIQVKAASGKGYQRTSGYSAQVLVPLRQLQTPFTPELYYVFVLRHVDKWADFVVISRPDLYNEHTLNNVGTKTKAGGLLLNLAVRGAKLTCGSQTWNQYLNAFATWPVIQH